MRTNLVHLHLLSHLRIELPMMRRYGGTDVYGCTEVSMYLGAMSVFR